MLNRIINNRFNERQFIRLWRILSGAKSFNKLVGSLLADLTNDVHFRLGDHIGPGDLLFVLFTDYL